MNLKLNILLVVDRPDHDVLLKDSVEQLGFNLVIAASGDEALVLMLKTSFLLVLLDLQNTVGDSYKVVELIQQFETTKHVPLLMIVDAEEFSVPLSGKSPANAIDYVFTPVIPELVCSKIMVYSNLQQQIMTVREQYENMITLNGILPVCTDCKKIRNDRGDWDEIEAYIVQHTRVKFSHGICDSCLELHHPEVRTESITSHSTL